MGKIIDGKAEAAKLKEEIKNFVLKKKEENKRLPCLTAILVGKDGGSIFYCNNQRKLCDQLGVLYKLIELEESTSEAELINVIEELNNSKDVDGLILQLPLPKHINEKVVTSKISFEKDVDGLTDINMGKFYKGDECFVPCTPQSIIHLIKSTGVSIEGKNAVVIGRSNIVGKPVAQLLLKENATVTICHSKTKNIKDICKNADILVCALGKPGFVSEEFVKDGAVVIDVGTSMVEGKITGDVQFNSIIEKDVYITPVPGGVGALTTTILIKNACEASKKNVY
ncbi:bifunctional 5,10-methylenetetrahydrofolate dehydrogenase/5,10-methenyltetrahydrofolate cyclohydrolase [Candidatus Clostridium radicumherbarum]|uniref:Bifunctional protein FolD n=1 Tax=Candidatus Clostridium radicumherbarum TaxID=3381662 RepID=A0ABW8TUL9_9CLOT